MILNFIESLFSSIIGLTGFELFSVLLLIVILFVLIRG